ncbi:hypothetical protein DFP72DRAFT_932737, partial [Ephemerocybe angulata]
MEPIANQQVAGTQNDDPTGFFIPIEVRNIKDIVHEEIPIHSYLSVFIDSEPFQRLRDIKQLGTSSYVWPGATHTRFEHCIGVAHLARTLASRFKTNQPELGITNRDVACVEIAGLCHDLGHGPWSHVWDGIFMPQAQPDTPWQHEMGSDMMFDYLVKTYKIPISNKDVSFIKALIAGEPGQCDPSEKRYLFDIVANKRNGLDVDKFDYIQRDSRMTGENLTFPVLRILHSAKVLDNQICYKIKDANQIYRICQRRYELHKHVYNHKTARAIEYMIVDALLLAEPHMKIAERVYKPESFLRLNDYIKNEIEMSQGPELEASRQIFKRIKHRDLYRSVDQKNIKFADGEDVKTYVTRERIYDKLMSNRASEQSAETDVIDNFDLQVGDIIVDITMMHHGMKQHNPVDFTKFYSKLTNAPMNAGPGDYSELRPVEHAELLLRIYSKKSDMKYLHAVQEAYRAVMDDLDVLLELKANPSMPAVVAATATPGPETPAAQPTVPLPATPGSDTASERTRKFSRVGSRNHFTSFKTSPLSNTRRLSSDLSSNTASTLSSHASDTSPSPFTTFEGCPLADLFQDEEGGKDPAVAGSSAATAVGGKRAREGEDENDSFLPVSDGLGIKRRR